MDTLEKACNKGVQRWFDNCQQVQQCTVVPRGTADDSLWPMIQKKLVVLNKAGLSKDNFEEAGERNMEMEKQRTIDEFYKPKEEEEGGVEELWGVCGEEGGDMTDADLEQLCQEPPTKKPHL